MNHTQLLNLLAAKYNLESYLEIGLQNPANNFYKIQCPIKCSVDPDPNAKAMFDCTSDEFFKINKNRFSLIFIDGYHEASQVERDFNNAVKCITVGGFIVVHDTLPTEEQYTTIPRSTKIWFGDVYKWAMKLGQYRDFIDFRTVNIDCGCTVIWQGKAEMKGINRFVNWENYIKDRDYNMRIIEASELDKYLPKVKETAT